MTLSTETGIASGNISETRNNATCTECPSTSIDLSMDNTKICAGCGEPFSRPTGTNRISDARWAIRDSCTFRCNFYQTNGKGGPIPQRDEVKSRAAASCEAHLRALVRYGLRHDGLPGLPANDLLRLASELGVAA